MSRSQGASRLVSGAIVVVAVLGIAAGPAMAERVYIQVAGTVDAVFDPDNALGGAVTLAAPITGLYTYETTTPADTGTGPDVDGYTHAAEFYWLRAWCGGKLFETPRADYGYDGHFFRVEIVDNYNNFDTYHIFDGYAPGIAAALPDVISLSLQLDDSTMTALTSTALPTSAPTLSDWTRAKLTVEGTIDWQGGPGSRKAYMFTADITSITLVPEPATMALLGLGLLGLVARRRR